MELACAGFDSERPGPGTEESEPRERVEVGRKKAKKGQVGIKQGMKT